LTRIISEILIGLILHALDISVAIIVYERLRQRRELLEQMGVPMESATFRRWLAKRGCTFDRHKRAQGKVHGIASVTVRRGRRVAELPAVGSRKRLDPAVVRKIVDDLGLPCSQLPGPASRV
jgi:hypothetical protein